MQFSQTVSTRTDSVKRWKLETLSKKSDQQETKNHFRIFFFSHKLKSHLKHFKDFGKHEPKLALSAQQAILKTNTPSKSVTSRDGNCSADQQAAAAPAPHPLHRRQALAALPQDAADQAATLLTGVQRQLTKLLPLKGSHIQLMLFPEKNGMLINGHQATSACTFPWQRPHRGALLLEEHGMTGVQGLAVSGGSHTTGRMVPQVPHPALPALQSWVRTAPRLPQERWRLEPEVIPAESRHSEGPQCHAPWRDSFTPTMPAPH